MCDWGISVTNVGLLTKQLSPIATPHPRRGFLDVGSMEHSHITGSLQLPFIRPADALDNDDAAWMVCS